MCLQTINLATVSTAIDVAAIYSHGRAPGGFHKRSPGLLILVFRKLTFASEYGLFFFKNPF